MTDFAWPADLPPAVQGFWLQPHVGRSESPFTRQQKTYGLSAPRWICSMQFRGGSAGTSGEAAFGPRVDAQLAMLKGGENRSLVYDFRRQSMRGAGWTAAATNIAAAAGATSMVLTGFAASALKVALEGDLIGGDGRPHLVTRDANADGSGAATIYFEPPLESFVGPDAAIFGNPPGIFRLTSDDAGSNTSEVGGLASYSLELVEDLDRWPTPKVAAIGHSFVQRNNTAPADGSYIQSNAAGEIVTAQALNPRFEFIVLADPDAGAPTYWRGANFGVAGDTSTMVLARLEALKAFGADIWIIDCILNDVRNSIASATTMANITAIAAAGLALGVQVIIANASPVAVDAEGAGTWSLVDAKRATLVAVNTLVAAYCTATRRVTLWDRWTAYNNAGVPITGYTDDGIHPSRLGAWKAGGPSLNTALDLVIDSNASALPTGDNLYSNGEVTGTGGTTGAGVTGTLPTGWTFANATGTGGAHATAVGSQSGGHQRFVITATASGTNSEIFLFGRDVGAVTVVPGTWVQAWADVTLSAWAGWRQVIKRASVVDGMDYASFSATDSMATSGSTRVRIVTPPFFVPEGTTSVSPQLVVVIDGQANGAGTLDIAELGLAVVRDPRLRYHFGG
ncbi:MAG: hypothetical protein QOH47_801 [Sphingomonadales bacterium]|jgi:lysophospholipase L1-like esterase|nr:hypothetical protein [Sphingomonadales bacterium]